jgi:hypothetical protein
VPANSVDLGAVLVDGVNGTNVVNHTFTVSNRSRRTIHFLEKECSCQCSKTDLARNVLKPGESTQFSIEANLAETVADLHLQCNLITDDPGRPSWPYIIKLRSYPRFSWNEQSWNLGKIIVSHDSANVSRSYSLTTYSTAESTPPRISSLESDPPLISECVSSATLNTLYAGTIRQRDSVIQLSIQPPSKHPDSLEFGFRNQVLKIRLTDGSEISKLVTWEWIPPLIAVPSQIHFCINGNQSGKQALVIKHMRDVPFRIVNVHGDGMSLESSPDDTKESRSSHTLTCSLIPGLIDRVAQFTSGTFKVMTDLDACRELSIRWSAWKQSGSSPLP